LSQINITPTIEYIGDTLPVNIGKGQIAHNLWRDTEHIYMGPVPKNKLSLPSEQQFIKVFETFYKKKLYNNVYKGPNCTELSNIEIKDFAKLCWLVNEYFTNGFTSLYSAHYNPRTGQNVIHPGGGRKFVDTFYNPQDHIEMFYFNTLGVQYDFLDKMRIVEYPVLEKMGYEATFVADHGSIIPHVFWSSNNRVKLDTTSVAMQKYLLHYQNRAGNIQVHSNRRLPDYFVKHVNRKKYDFYITFYKEYNDFDFVKAMFIGLTEQTYSDANISVTQRSR